MKKYSLAINGTQYAVKLLEVTTEEVKAEVNGVVHTVTIEDIENVNLFQTEQPVVRKPAPPVQAKPDRKVAKTGDFCSFGTANLHAPIPGQIISVDVQTGDIVKKGDRLFILEAMKMENILTASQDGVIREVLVECGEAVTQDQLLIVFE